MSETVFEMCQVAIGGLGLFLLGMKLLSDGMQALAGNRLNRLICAVTDNRFMGILVGIGVTCVIQSSSATTVMVVGFVNSGLMTLMQALGVIFGANIGTTLSLWILTLPAVSSFGALIIGVSSFVYLFATKDKTRFIGMAVLGLGMLFFGLELMSKGFEPLRYNQGLCESLTLFRATSTLGFIKAVLVGTVFTAIVQSSAAVIVIVMSLAFNNVLDFPTSVAIVLGSNIGTTITAALACIGASRGAIRAALAHTLFNIFGVVGVTLFQGPFIDFSLKAALWITHNSTGTLAPGDFRVAIACVHTLFNVSCTIILFPFMRLFAKAVTIMVPVRKEEAKSERYKPQYLDKRLLNNAPVALEQAKKEILRMGYSCLEMLDDLDLILSTDRNAAREEAIFHAEDNLDVAQKEIAEYVSALLHDSVTHEVAISARREIRQADEFESVSDHIRNALKAYLKIRNAGETLSSEADAEVLDLCEQDRKYCTDVMDLLARDDKARVTWAIERNKDIDSTAKKYRDRHMQRLTVSCTSPVKSLVYSDILIAFRRVNDHLLNIAETLKD